MNFVAEPLPKGKLPAVHTQADLLLTDYVDVEKVLYGDTIWKPHDTGFPLAMYGNGPDNSVEPGFPGAGNCVWAMFCEIIQLLRHASGKTRAPLTGKEAIGAYSEFTGYVIGDDSTDGGTSMATAMSQVRHTGIKDAHGTRHKIGAYLSITPGASDAMQAAIKVFEAIGIGINFPSYADAQFAANQNWTYRAGGTNVGGHAIVTSRPPIKGVWDIISWARLFGANSAFLTHQCDEAWAFVDLELLNGKKETPEGLDLAKLNADIGALKSVA